MKNILKIVGLAVLLVSGGQMAMAQNYGLYGSHYGSTSLYGSNGYHRSNSYGTMQGFDFSNNHPRSNQGYGIGGYSSHYRGGGHVHHNVDPRFNTGRGNLTWHDTSHYHYNSARVVPHGNHYHYQPGHYSLHQTGHYDLHHR